MTPVTITSFRIFTGAVTVFVVLSLLRRVRFPYKREWVYILVGALLNVVFHHAFLALGVLNTSATNTGLILGMGPLLTVILAVLFFGKRLTSISSLGFILASIGVSVTVLFGSGSLTAVKLGDVYVFLSIFSQAISFLVINKASKTMDTVLLTGYMLLVGSGVLFVTSLWLEPNGLASIVSGFSSFWWIFAISAIVATGLGHIIYNYAISQIGAAEASIFLNLNTFFSIVGAALFLNETIHPSHYIGLVLIVSGVLLGSGTLEAIILKRKARNV